MASTSDIQLLQKEAQLLLAKQAFQKNQVSSVVKAANLYDIPRTSLQERLNGRVPLSTSNSRKRKLSPSEEHALV
jgi:helix-turn-helix, Psq domain